MSFYKVYLILYFTSDESALMSRAFATRKCVNLSIVHCPPNSALTIATLKFTFHCPGSTGKFCIQIFFPNNLEIVLWPSLILNENCFYSSSSSSRPPCLNFNYASSKLLEICCSDDDQLNCNFFINPMFNFVVQTSVCFSWDAAQWFRVRLPFFNHRFKTRAH